MSSARGFMDDAPIEAHCPQCGRKVKTTVRASRRGRSMRCPGGHRIEVDGSGLDRETRKVERELNKVLRRFPASDRPPHGRAAPG